MNVLRNTKIWTLALALVAAATSAYAQQQPLPVPNLQPGARTPQVTPYVVGQALPPADPGQRVVTMTLDQAIQMALEKNLGLKVARMNPQSVDYQLQAARAAFNPTFTSTYGYNNAQTLNNNNLEQRATITSVRQTYNGGVSELLPFHGANLSVAFNNSRSNSNSSQNLANTTYTSSLGFTYTQPLLQGFQMDNTRNTLRTLDVQRQIVDSQLQTTIANTSASVRTAYWNLRGAIEQIEIARQARDLAQQLWDDNKTKVTIGTLAQIDTVQNEASVAQAEQTLLAAQSSWQTAQLALQTLLASGPDDDINKAVINPTELPVAVAPNVDINGAVQKALTDRTDLVQAKENLQISQLNLEINKDALKPTLNLSAGYSGAGQGPNALNKTGGYGLAANQVFTFAVPTWNVNFNFNYPLGMAANHANYARAVLALDQSQAQLKASELSVASSVTNAGLAVKNTYLQYQAAQKSSQAQQRSTEAEQARFDAGMSINYNVVQQQNALVQARLTELRALISYINAVAEFDRIQKFGN